MKRKFKDGHIALIHISHICLNCNKEFTNKKYNEKVKFCTIKCSRQYRNKEIENRINILIDKGLAPATPKAARKLIIKLNGYECSICKLYEWQNKSIPLVLDHINGDSDDWHLTNLRMLCCNCDAQTDTYKRKNIGKGRHSRRERYKQGLSY